MLDDQASSCSSSDSIMVGTSAPQVCDTSYCQSSSYGCFDKLGGPFWVVLRIGANRSPTLPFGVPY